MSGRQTFSPVEANWMAPLAILAIAMRCSGGLSRLPFALGMAAIFLALAGIAWLQNTTAEAGWPAVGQTLPMLLLAVICWSWTAMVLKRLTDMGRSRLHIIWILAASLLTTLAGSALLPVSLVLGLFNLAVLAWLLLAASAPSEPSASVAACVTTKRGLRR